MKKMYWRPRTFFFLYFILLTAAGGMMLLNHDFFFPQTARYASHLDVQYVINEDYNAKHTELVKFEERLTKERELIENMLVHLRQQYPQATDSIMNRLNVSNASLPTIYAITPTYTRPVQKAELTRISQTFLHVRHLHWIVVEDSETKTSLVTSFLYKSGVRYTHLNCQTPKVKPLKKKKAPIELKPRGLEQRNTAIDWLLTNVNASNDPGVVYFADDDNTYDLRVFEEMRYTKNVSVWPVGFVGGLMYESPRVDRNGKVIGWIVGWGAKRPFPMDMAGFAINLGLLKKFPHVRFSNQAKSGYLESSFLASLVKVEDLEPKANMCTQIYVWHTRTEKPVLAYKVNNSDIREV